MSAGTGVTCGQRTTVGGVLSSHRVSLELRPLGLSASTFTHEPAHQSSFIYFVELGIEHRTMHLLGKSSTTDLYLQPSFDFLGQNFTNLLRMALNSFCS